MRPLPPNFWKERRDAMGLGDRGKNQVKKGSPSGLFARTEPGATEIQASSDTKIQNHYKYRNTRISAREK